MVRFGVGEGEAGGFGAVAAGVVVGVDAEEERLDISGGGVRDDSVEGCAAVSVPPPVRVDQVGQAHGASGVGLGQEGAVGAFAVVADPAVVDVAAEERDRRSLLIQADPCVAAQYDRATEDAAGVLTGQLQLSADPGPAAQTALDLGVVEPVVDLAEPGLGQGL